MNKSFKVYLPKDYYKELILYDSLFHPKILSTGSGSVIPQSYSISCSNLTQNLVVSNPTLPFFVVPTTVSTGIATIIFLDNFLTEISRQTITFNSTNPILITPPENTVTIEYIFYCSPLIINLICPDAQSLDPTLPYSFANNTVDTIQIELIKPGEFVGSTLLPGEIYSPVPSYGYTNYTTVCVI